MNDANNAGMLLSCPFCRGGMMFRKALWPSDGCVDAIIHEQSTNCGLIEFSNGTTDESIITAWNTRALSTPNAPVEPAGLRSLRHLLAHMPDKDLRLRRFDAQQLLQFIDAILAVRLDEAVIRKDEREKCAAIAEWKGYATTGRQIAQAIRNGGTAIIIGSDARAIIQAARAFTNAAKEKTDAS